MTRHFALAAVLAAVAPIGATADEANWIFRASYYSHSPKTGERAVQYRSPPPAIVRFDPTYQESAYRHNHASLVVGGGQDQLHIVQTWGQGELIRPYGEWEYPYRAGATPFGPWGNPSGPWTLPFDSWSNPYGLGKLRHPPLQVMPIPVMPSAPAVPATPAPEAVPAPVPEG